MRNERVLNLSSREDLRDQLIDFFKAYAAMEAELAESKKQAQELNARVEALLNSKSWQVTRPLRAVLGFFQALADRYRKGKGNALRAEPIHTASAGGECETRQSGELEFDSKDLLNQIFDDQAFERAESRHGSTFDRPEHQNATHTRNRSPLERWTY